MTKPKYRPGRKFRTVGAFAKHLDAGGWTYWPSDGRPKHPGIMMSMTFRTIALSIKGGHLRRAVAR